MQSPMQMSLGEIDAVSKVMLLDNSLAFLSIEKITFLGTNSTPQVQVIDRDGNCKILNFELTRDGLVGVEAERLKDSAQKCD
jgi:hypothetical protein